LFRGLSPIKIYINGPPASGKSYFGGKLAQMYDIPHIKITDVVELAGSLEGEEGDKIRSFINTKKDETMEEFEKTKKKGQELSRDEIVVKLPDDIIHKLAKIKLNENTCRNKGYVLDGFPKTYNDCYHTFYDKKKKYDKSGKEIIEQKPKRPEGEEEQEPLAEDKEEQSKPIDWENDYELNKNMIPRVFIQLNGDQEAIKTRMKELPEEKTRGTHWTDADQDRRMDIYSKTNFKPEGEEEPPKVLKDFFTEHEIPHFSQNCLEEESKIVEKLEEILSQIFSPP
jgi:adenylate kinase